MLYVFGVTVALAILIVAFWFRQGSRYYRQVFSDRHYTEIANWATGVILGDQGRDQPSDDLASIVTSADLTLAYSSHVEAGKRFIHFSVSQRGRPTTGAVGGRVLFLLHRLVHRNEPEVLLFRTRATVHHAIFSIPCESTWTPVPTEQAVADMLHFQHVPIRLVDAGG